MYYTIMKYLNLGLLFIFPMAWFAPLMRTQLVPEWKFPNWLGSATLFGPETITVISGIQKLWATDVALALAVTFFALVAPMLKCGGTALIQFGMLSSAVKPIIMVMAKLAMADIFIVSIYIVIAKGIGIGSIEIDWGLYLFTGAVILSFMVSIASK